MQRINKAHARMNTFLQTLAVQRWDDHRYYHHSMVNQALHLMSALSFLFAYLLVFADPAKAALVGWLVAMTSRQIGHIFFEPKGYDAVNHATHEYKEAIKVGYNLRRKFVLLALWILSPVLLLLDPTLLGLLEAHGNAPQFLHNVGVLWLIIGIGGLLFRTVQLCLTRDTRTGLVWCTKILTDPFHDIKLYHKAPIYLFRGRLSDPIAD
jgi:hypothetical protein